MQVVLSVRTRESLRNLFAILDTPGDSFDDQLFELATLAFSAASVPVDPLRRRRERMPRRHIDMKGQTYQDLRDLHNRLFPFLPWQSWDWLLHELVTIAVETQSTRKFSFQEK